MVQFKLSFIPMLIAACITLPVLAEANFEQLTLAPNFDRKTARVSGHTGGSFSLSSIARRDYRNQPCIGFGAPNPDHIMVLEEDFERLRILVRSGGNDTTLIIQGPNPSNIRCGDDTDSRKDASIEDLNWAAGTYRIWVGSFEPRQRWNYRLVVRE